MIQRAIALSLLAAIHFGASAALAYAMSLRPRPYELSDFSGGLVAAQVSFLSICVVFGPWRAAKRVWFAFAGIGAIFLATAPYRSPSDILFISFELFFLGEMLLILIPVLLLLRRARVRLVVATAMREHAPARFTLRSFLLGVTVAAVTMSTATQIPEDPSLMTWGMDAVASLILMGVFTFVATIVVTLSIIAVSLPPLPRAAMHIATVAGMSATVIVLRSINDFVLARVWLFQGLALYVSLILLDFCGYRQIQLASVNGTGGTTATDLSELADECQARGA